MRAGGKGQWRESSTGSKENFCWMAGNETVGRSPGKGPLPRLLIPFSTSPIFLHHRTSMPIGGVLYSPSLKMTRHLVCTLMLVIVATACMAPDEAGDSVGDKELSPKEIEQLLALGYIDYAEEISTGEPPTTIHDPDRVSPGYTLYVVKKHCLANLIDLEGNVVKTWREAPCGTWSHGEILPDGDLLVNGSSGAILRMSWDGEIRSAPKVGAHHDQEITPDGDLACLSSQKRRLPEIHPRFKVNDSVIVRLDRNGKVADSMSLYDVLSDNAIGYRFLDRTVIRKSEVDMFHANSVEWVRPKPEWDLRPGSVYEPGNLLVSVRHQDSIVVINWPRRELVWAWGQGVISAPHDASWLENGNILLFDNGVYRERSRVVEVDPRNGNIVWEYNGGSRPFYSKARGSAQRLPNDNTLVAVSDSGYAFEVTGDGQVVWEFWNPIQRKRKRATIVRAKRYEPQMIEPLLRKNPRTP